MQIEREIKDFQKNWVQANRDNLRQSLLRRHQEVKEVSRGLTHQLKKKAGVKDPNYDNVRSFSVADQRVGGGTISPSVRGAGES